MKSLPVGTQSFVELRRNNRYYVDKTAFIKRVLADDSADVLLITRPRRFGKTLFMDTLKNFLQIDVNRPGEVTERRDLFEGLEILKDAEFCKTYMCQCPTIFLSLKSAEGPTFQRAYQAFARNLTQVAMAFSFLENSPNLSHEDKEFFKLYKNLNYMRDLAHQDDVQSFLQRMIAFLSQHFGRQVVVLIDEYDVPLAKAAASGYYDKMLPLIRGFLGEALKADPQTGSEARPYLKKAILTGCLRVSKESIFTGLNNLTINTVWSEDLSLAEAIGFTPTDVSQMLEYYGLSSRSEDVKLWYDGYKLVGKDIYCPWDVISYLRDFQYGVAQKPKSYWKNTSDNAIIRSFIDYAGDNITTKLETLMAGGSIVQHIEENLTYDYLHSSEENLWSVLYLTGYLTKVRDKDLPDSLPDGCSALMIPNAEIREIFETTVSKWFDDSAKAWNRSPLFDAVWSGNSEALTKEMTKLLRMTISYHDYREDFYHAFLAGIFTGAGYVVESNKEHGEGRSDVIVKDIRNGRVAIFEAKYAKTLDALPDACDTAIQQINDRMYAADFRDDYDDILCYGIAFFKKRCMVRKK